MVRNPVPAAATTNATQTSQSFGILDQIMNSVGSRNVRSVSEGPYTSCNPASMAS